MSFRLLCSALLQLLVKGMNGVFVCAHERQLSNAYLVIGLFGSLATILKSSKVSSLPVSSHHDIPPVEGPPAGFEEERGAVDPSFAGLEDTVTVRYFSRGT